MFFHNSGLQYSRVNHLQMRHLSSGILILLPLMPDDTD